MYLRTFFKIELPASTVTLDAVDGKATYAKVTAKTADHTLIIKEGVTVKELVIAGGNVEVYGTVKIYHWLMEIPVKLQ